MTRPLSYYAWPLAIIVFFVVLAAGNTALYIVANDPGGESKPIEAGAYEQGINYQGKLDALDRFQKAGYRADCAITNQDSGATLEVRVADKTGAPLAGRKISARMIYAASGGSDQNLDLTETADVPGVYRAPIKALPGIYFLSLKFDDQIGELEFDTKLSN